MGVNGIYGLSGSGMDIDSLVKVGMMQKQKEYDKMEKSSIKNSWIKTAYLELNNNVTTFNMSTLSQYKMSSNMNAKTAETTSSDIKVDANASAPVMNHKVEVTELSSAAYVISDKLSSNKLQDMFFKSLTYDATNNEYTYKVDVNGTTRTKTVNGNEKAVEFSISDGTGSDAKSATISFTMEEVYNGATMNDLVSKINNSGTNIKATYDSVNDRFSMYNTKGGLENTITITTGQNYSDASGTRLYSGRVAANFFNSMNLQQIKNGATTSKTLEFSGPNKTDSVAGSNGNIRVDGIDYATTENKTIVGGITYTALKETTEPATVTITQDVDAIVEKVKSFVEDYNKLLSGLYEKYDEKPESGYSPLTQSQKDAMKEEQITKWEEKAKKGLLYHDKTLGKIINELRSCINTPVDGIEGKYNSAYSIGISTKGLKGQLTLDEDKLRKALAEDSDAVYNVFAKLDSGEKVAVKNADGTIKKDSNGNVVYKTVERSSYNGIAQRMGDILTAAQKSIKSRAGSSADITEDSDLNTLLRQLQTKMSNFKKMMKSYEDKLYKKYDKMESMLSKLMTQGNFLFNNNQ